MVAPLRIVFFGTPQFAVPTLDRLLSSRHDVCGVITQPDRPRGRGQKVTDSPVKAAAVAHHIPVLQPERLRDPSLVEAIGGWRPDLGVVAAYGRLIPDALLALPRYGMINVHPSLLPKYRGSAPVHRAVLNGDTMTGVTIMRVSSRLDAGATFAVLTRPIGPDETSDAIENDLAEKGADLLVSVADQIAAGTAHEEPQDEAMATYSPRLTREDGLIDWSQPASAIHNRVRGLYPWPHAYTHLEGARLIILRTRVISTAADAAPGVVTDVSRNTIEVAAGEGRITIDELQPQGKRAMRTRDYLAGRPVVTGARFTAS